VHEAAPVAFSVACSPLIRHDDFIMSRGPRYWRSQNGPSGYPTPIITSGKAHAQRHCRASAFVWMVWTGWGLCWSKARCGLLRWLPPGHRRKIAAA